MKLLDHTNLSELEKIDHNNQTLIDCIYDLKSEKVNNHLQIYLNKLKLLYQNQILESIDDWQTVIAKSFLNPIADLNIIDIQVDFIY